MIGVDKIAEAVKAALLPELNQITQRLERLEGRMDDFQEE